VHTQPDSSRTGVMLAGICLLILGVMPIIVNSRPGGFSALSFAFFLSVWQLVFSLPLLLRGLASSDKGIFGSDIDRAVKKRTLTVLVSTGVIFGLSTYAYVLAVEKAGAVSAAIAIVSYPLFAILWETLFLGRRKTAFELGLTGLLVIALFYLATGGTWRIDGFSVWFLFALSVPFLWSVAHVIIKEMLGRTPITPAQITFIRVLVSSVFLGVVLFATADVRTVLDDLANLPFQAFALAMGLVYYLELIIWFHAVRTIDVSLASSITVPWPALTMVLAIVFLGEPVAIYQIVAFAIVAVSIYGLILADARKRPVPA